MIEQREKLWNISFITACTVNFLLFFAFYMLLPVLPIYLSEQFFASKTVIGFILASYTLTTIAFRPFAGYMVDSFRRKTLLLCCYLFFILYFGGYLLASTLFIFALVRATHGFSFGMVTISMNTIAIDVMPSGRRGEGIGYYGISTNLAMAIGPVVSLYILDITKNFQYIFLTSLLIGLFGWLLINLIKDPKPVQGPKHTISLDRFLLIKAIPGAVSLMLISFTYGVLSSYIVIYGQNEVGIESGAGWFFMYLSAGLVISRMVSGRLINKGYISELILIGTLASTLGCLVLVFFKIPVAFYFSAIVLGFGYGFICPSFQTMFINLADHNQRGTATATYFTSWDLGTGAGVLLGGAIAQGGSYAQAFSFGTLCILFGLGIFYFFSLPYYQKNRLR